MATIPVSNESESTYSRITRDGRKLTYNLRVLQEPERARACGSTAKSSADRRPVDPPPVIELKIFEGEQKTDITFQHKANFFIFTTLETARPIAQARGQPAAQPPVLTGQPVSGAALLDRPSPAAYFIFPDLSVRHEGKYRLSFNLYEELKDPKDEDAHTPGSLGHQPLLPGMMGGGNLMMPQAHVRFRMEVRSKPFVVYSAKKFPGLTESTPLSRVVAEQGCRVRIRRDVRMRRRENKGSSKDSTAGDHAGDHASYGGYPEPASADPYRQQQQQQVAVDQQQQQPSSAVDSSYYGGSSYPTPTYAHAQVPGYAPAPQPRPSSQQQFHHPAPPPPPPQQMSSVDAGVVANTSPYGQTYHQQHYGAPPHAHTRHPSAASSHEGLAQSYQAGPPAVPAAYPQPEPSAAARSQYEIETASGCNKYFDQISHGRVAIDNIYSRHGAPPPPPPPPYATSDMRVPTPNSSTSLPPLKNLPTVDLKQESYPGVPDIYNMPSASPASIAASVRAGSKRGYDRTFDAGLGMSMTNGSRPTASGQEVAQIETDDGMINVDDLLNCKTLSYRRANGSLQTKKIPSPSGI